MNNMDILDLKQEKLEQIKLDHQIEAELSKNLDYAYEYYEDLIMEAIEATNLVVQAINSHGHSVTATDILN